MAFDTGNRIRATWILACALALGASAHAADLAAIYRLAQDSDPAFAEAQARLDAAREKLAQGRAGLLPSVALSAHATSNREEVENRTLNRTDPWNYGSHGYTLSLTQPLFRWQAWVVRDQSERVVAQAEAAFLNARQDLILRTAQAYFEVLQARSNVEAARVYRTAVDSRLDIAREAFRLGSGIKTDMHDAETRAAAAATQLIAAETEYELRQRALEAIIGRHPPALADKHPDTRVGAPQPSELAVWLEAADQGNLVVQQQRLATEIAGLEVDRLRAGHYPTLDLVASAGNTSALSSGQRQVTQAGRIGVQLNVPLFQGGEVSSKAAEAAAGRRAAVAALEAARRAAALATRQAYLGVVNGIAQIRVAQDGVLAARHAVQSNQDAFSVGVRLNIDVLNAQSQLLAAQRELYRVTVETLMAQLRLKAAVGTLGEADVTALNALLATS